jgi:hypothetical protein
MQEFGISESSLIGSNLPTPMMTYISRQLTSGTLAIAGSVATFGFGAIAQAASIVQTASFPSLTGTTSTNFSGQALTPSLTQFDSSLGTLNFVRITLDGRVTGSAQLESLDAAPANVNYNLQATVGLSVTGISGNIVEAIPIASGTFAATAFDGTIDFGGTSGASFTNLSGNASQTVTLTSNLSPFIGTGTLAAFLSGSGQSLGSGAGNLVTLFATQAGGTVTIEYDFTPPVVGTPEPSAMLGILAVAGAGALARRKT